MPVGAVVPGAVVQVGQQTDAAIAAAPGAATIPSGPVRGNDAYADIYVKFKWALRPGAPAPFTQPSGLYYQYYDLGNKNSGSYYFAKPEKFDAREGEFSVNFRIVAQDHGYFRAFCERFTFDNHFAVYHRAGGYFHASNATS